MMTNLHGAIARTSTLTTFRQKKKSVKRAKNSIMNGHAGIQTKCTGETRLTTIDMYDPDDDHSSDYAEERHNSKCEARDIDQGIKPLIDDDEDEE